MAYNDNFVLLYFLTCFGFIFGISTVVCLALRFNLTFRTYTYKQYEKCKKCKKKNKVTNISNNNTAKNTNIEMTKFEKKN